MAEKASSIASSTSSGVDVLAKKQSSRSSVPGPPAFQMQIYSHKLPVVHPTTGTLPDLGREERVSNAQDGPNQFDPVRSEQLRVVRLEVVVQIPFQPSKEVSVQCVIGRAS